MEPRRVPAKPRPEMCISHAAWNVRRSAVAAYEKEKQEDAHSEHPPLLALRRRWAVHKALGAALRIQSAEATARFEKDLDEYYKARLRAEQSADE